MFAILDRDNHWWFMGTDNGYPILSRQKEQACTFEEDEIDAAVQLLRDYGIPCRRVELK